MIVLSVCVRVVYDCLNVCFSVVLSVCLTVAVKGLF